MANDYDRVQALRKKSDDLMAEADAANISGDSKKASELRDQAAAAAREGEDIMNEHLLRNPLAHGPEYTEGNASNGNGSSPASASQGTSPSPGGVSSHALVDFGTAVKHLASGPYNGLRDIELRMRAMSEGIDAMGDAFKLMSRYLQEIQIEAAAVDKTSQLGDMEKSAARQAEELANLFHVLYTDIMRHRERGLRVPDHNTVNRGL